MTRCESPAASNAIPGEPLWAPSADRAAAAEMTRFLAFCEKRIGTPLDGAALRAWPTAELAAFWEAVWDFFDVVGEKGDRRLIDADKMPGARASFQTPAENLLRAVDGVRSDDDALEPIEASR